MKKIKLNKIKLGLSLLGIIGVTALAAPMLVSCGDNSKPTNPEPGKPIEGVTSKATNDLSIWEMNAIAAGNRNIKLLSRAFDGINEDNIKNIQKVQVSNNVITISSNIAGNFIKSNASTNTTTILTKELTDIYFGSGNIWANKTTFNELDLKGTTEIGTSAFENKKLPSITIPSTVTVLGKEAFIGNNFKTYNDIKITAVLLNSTCSWNNKTVKENFELIFGIRYPKGVTPTALFSIDPWTLNAYNNGTIPNTVEFLLTAFTGIDATNIADVSNIRINSNNQIVISYDGKDITSVKPTLSTTVLTEELVDKFFATDGIWVGKTTFNELDLKDTTQIGRSAFYGKRLTSLTIPNSITSIDDNAFANNRISSLIIPSSLTSIGSNIFTNNAISSLTIPSSVTSIGYGAFKANHLRTFTIPDTVSFIDAYAFHNNHLTSVKIGNGVKTIGKDAFRWNQFKSFKDIDISDALLNSTCSWNGKTVKENFESIFGVVDRCIATYSSCDNECNLFILFEARRERDKLSTNWQILCFGH